MIAWYSYKTAKMLPTFVGTEYFESSTSRLRNWAKGFDYRRDHFGEGTSFDSEYYYTDPFVTYHYKLVQSTVKLYSFIGGNRYSFSAWQSYSDFEYDKGFLSSTVVEGRTTRIDRPFYDWNASSIKNDSTSYEAPYLKRRQQTSYIETLGNGTPVRTTTTLSAITYGDDENDVNIEPLEGYIWTTRQGETALIFELTTTRTTETVATITIRNSPQTRVNTSEKEVEEDFATYLASDGDVVVVADVNVVAPPGVFFATFDLMNGLAPVSEFPYILGSSIKFEWTDSIIGSYPVRDKSLSGQPATSTETTWLNANQGLTGQYQRPVYVNRNSFPWSSSSLYPQGYISNYQVLITSSSQVGTIYRHTWSTTSRTDTQTANPPRPPSPSYNEEGGGGNEAGASASASVKTGLFNKLHGYYGVLFFNTHSPVRTTRVGPDMRYLKPQPIPFGGVAGPSAISQTQNNVTSFAQFLSANAQHTVNLSFNYGNIIPELLGAEPLTPTFTAIANATTISGSRAGAGVTTTAAWKSLVSGKQIVTTESGQFSLQTQHRGIVGLGEYGNRPNSRPFVIGGFEVPNPSHTVVVGPGAYRTTTFNSAGSGVQTTSYTTGRSYAAGQQGEVPISVINAIPLVGGYGWYSETLVDRGEN